MAKATGPGFHDLFKSLKKGEYAPLYLFHGEEDYFIDALSDYIEAHALAEEQRPFNQTVVYGRDLTGGQVLDMAGRLPMMAPRQVVVVREAQDLRELGVMENYALKPVPSTVLVLCHKHKKVDGRTALVKRIQEGPGIVFESKKLYDDKIPDWIKAWLKDEGYDITPEALALAHEYLGNQLSNITSQFRKVMISLEKGSTIEVEVIRKGIGISREYNVFELQKALGLRQTERVYHILDQMNRDIKSNPLPQVVSSLCLYFIKIYTLHQMHGAKEDEMAKAIGIHPFLMREFRPVTRQYQPTQLEQIIGLLFEADLKSKGVGRRDATEGDILKELCHRILLA